MVKAIFIILLSSILLFFSSCIYYKAKPTEQQALDKLKQQLEVYEEQLKILDKLKQQLEVYEEQLEILEKTLIKLQTGLSAGYIKITSNPSGAKIFIDEEDTKCETPHNIVASCGDRSVRIEKSGVPYINNPRNVKVLQNETTPVHFESE